MSKRRLKEELKRIKAAMPATFREAYEMGFRDGLTVRGRGGRMKPDGMSYEGEVNADGQPHGYGAMTWPNGRRYEGEIRAGRPHGWGVMRWADGKRHEGRFREGAPVEASRTRYEGEVNADGQPHGYGVMTWPNGERHEGRFREGAPVEESGTRYKGEVNADGQPHGYGVMTWPNGERHEGKFSKGAPSRRVRLIGHTHQVTAGPLPETVSGSEPIGRSIYPFRRGIAARRGAKESIQTL